MSRAAIAGIVERDLECQGDARIIRRRRRLGAEGGCAFRALHARRPEQAREATSRLAAGHPPSLPPGREWTRRRNRAAPRLRWLVGAGGQPPALSSRVELAVAGVAAACGAATIRRSDTSRGQIDHVSAGRLTQASRSSRLATLGHHRMTAGPVGHDRHGLPIGLRFCDGTFGRSHHSTDVRRARRIMRQFRRI